MRTLIILFLGGEYFGILERIARYLSSMALKTCCTRARQGTYSGSYTLRCLDALPDGNFDHLWQIPYFTVRRRFEVSLSRSGSLCLACQDLMTNVLSLRILHHNNCLPISIYNIYNIYNPRLEQIDQYHLTISPHTSSKVCQTFSSTRTSSFIYCSDPT